MRVLICLTNEVGVSKGVLYNFEEQGWRFLTNHEKIARSLIPPENAAGSFSGSTNATRFSGDTGSRAVGVRTGLRVRGQQRVEREGDGVGGGSEGSESGEAWCSVHFLKINIACYSYRGTSLMRKTHPPRIIIGP